MHADTKQKKDLFLSGARDSIIHLVIRNKTDVVEEVFTFFSFFSFLA